MALTATIYNLTVELADVDRGVYETFALRVARHPSESAEYMLARVLAYSLEYREGIAFTEGVSAVDEPPVIIRDLTGRLTGWIDVGAPDAARLHRASKLADRVAVYAHRDVKQWLAQIAGDRIHRASRIPIYAFDRAMIDDVAARIERRSTIALSINEREMFLTIGDYVVQSPIVEHRLANPE